MQAAIGVLLMVVTAVWAFSLILVISTVINKYPEFWAELIGARYPFPFTSNRRFIMYLFDATAFFKSRNIFLYLTGIVGIVATYILGLVILYVVYLFLSS